MEIYLENLKSLAGVDITVDTPTVEYFETITLLDHSGAMAKSPNKHNRVYVSTDSLDSTLIDAISKLDATSDTKTNILKLKEDTDLKDDYINKIMAFSVAGPNILVDETDNLVNRNELIDFVIAAFQNLTSEGPLYGGRLRGVRFNLLDIFSHADAIQRGASQIIPPTTAVMTGTFLNSYPMLMEPVYLVEIQVPNEFVDPVTTLVHQKRGDVLDVTGDKISVVRAYLPVSQSFGINKDLMQCTKGKATINMIFDHYDNLPNSNPYAGDDAMETIMQLREPKS
ncbi:hypothetical protein ABW20_dc0100778 [Dactylellina cionopaga]|nr:hypothetical protein ABW20_dc0100778 [Dactylellina cionopaga]